MKRSEIRGMCCDGWLTNSKNGAPVIYMIAWGVDEASDLLVQTRIDSAIRPIWLSGGTSPIDIESNIFGL